MGVRKILVEGFFLQCFTSPVSASNLTSLTAGLLEPVSLARVDLQGVIAGVKKALATIWNNPLYLLCLESRFYLLLNSLLSNLRHKFIL
jgi:hypothetical protein